MRMLRGAMQYGVAVGFCVVLTGCAINGPAADGEGARTEAQCEAAEPWPDWPGALPSTLLPEERALFKRAWSSGPNFACDALLVTRGCGTGCVTGLIHDAGTQRTYTLPFAIHREPGQDEPVLSYREDSSIIVATGWRNETEQGVFRYRWDGEQLHRIEE